MERIALILAGGRGERFWPLSTRKRPKQLLPLFSSRTLIEETFNRLQSFLPTNNIYVITPIDLLPAIKKTLSSLPDTNFIGEPEGKNTAPAIAFATLSLREKYPHATMGVFPADHYIRDESAFLNDLEVAFNMATDDRLITFGIPPTYPATGFGYIELGHKIAPDVYEVAHFKEKPNQKEAQEYLKSGKYLWNSGMFVWKIDTIIDAFHKHAPEFWPAMCEFVHHKDAQTLYSSLPSISIDYAIMEKARNVAVVKAHFTWNDIGAWRSLENIKPKTDTNVVVGDWVGIDSSDNIIYAEDGIIATIGVDNLIIVKSGNRVLVAHKDKDQEIKELVALLAKKKRYNQYL